MLKHLTQNRETDCLRGYSYKKTLVESTRRFTVKYPSGRTRQRETKSLCIAWDVFYQEGKICTLSTLKEVKHFINKYETYPIPHGYAYLSLPHYSTDLHFRIYAQIIQKSWQRLGIRFFVKSTAKFLFGITYDKFLIHKLIPIKFNNQYCLSMLRFF